MSNILEEKMRIEEPNYVETAELLQVDVLRKITGICKKNQVELGNEPVEISGQGVRGDITKILTNGRESSVVTEGSVNDRDKTERWFIHESMVYLFMTGDDGKDYLAPLSRDDSSALDCASLDRLRQRLSDLPGGEVLGFE